MTEPDTEAVPTEPTAPDPVDPAAPYGRRADGTPASKPGRKVGQKTGTGRRARRSPIGPKPPTAKPAGRSSAPKGPDYTEAINGMIQLPAGALALLGMRDPRFLADAGTLSLHGPIVAAALNDLARERPDVAAVLDRVLAAGPYGALIGAVFPLVLQMLANHGVVKPGLFGTVTPETMVGAMQDRLGMAAAA
jgi:hypothetical protein